MRGQFGGVRVTRSALLLLGAAVVLSLGVSSCQKPPQMEADQAKAAIEKAKTAEAAEYAPQDLSAAQDSLTKADTEVNTQNGKFALFRNYKKAKALYLSAQQTGATAEQNAIKNKEQARKDAEAALAKAKQDIQATKDLLNGKDAQALKRGKETREALKQIESELSATDSSLVQVQTLQGQEKYKQALSMANAADQKAQSLMQEVQQAIENRKSISSMKGGKAGAAPAGGEKAPKAPKAPKMPKAKKPAPPK